MRSIDERVAAVEKRLRELAKKKKHRCHCYIGLFVACLLAIIGMGAAMPGIMAWLPEGDYTNPGMMASLFYEGCGLCHF